jgi:hypothetical protein
VCDLGRQVGAEEGHEAQHDRAHLIKLQLLGEFDRGRRRPAASPCASGCMQRLR